MGCAAVEVVIPALRARSLLISLDKPGLEYPYKQCVKSLLGFCRKWESYKDEYDFTKPEVRKNLRDMGFVCQVRSKERQ